MYIYIYIGIAPRKKKILCWDAPTTNKKKMGFYPFFTGLIRAGVSFSSKKGSIKKSQGEQFPRARLLYKKV